MWSRGIIVFCDKKKVAHIKAIKMFLSTYNPELLKDKQVKANDCVQNNFEKFATFVDQKIKSGELKGTPVKLNTYFDEQRQRKDTVRKEFEDLNLSKEEQKLINLINDNKGIAASVIAKAGLSFPKQSESFISKKLSRLPVLRTLQENNLVETFIERIKI